MRSGGWSPRMGLVPCFLSLHKGVGGFLWAKSRVLCHSCRKREQEWTLASSPSSPTHFAAHRALG